MRRPGESPYRASSTTGSFINPLSLPHEFDTVSIECHSIWFAAISGSINRTEISLSTASRQSLYQKEAILLYQQSSIE